MPPRPLPMPSLTLRTLDLNLLKVFDAIMACLLYTSDAADE